MGQHGGGFALHDVEIAAREAGAFSDGESSARACVIRRSASSSVAGGIFCASVSSMITIKAESSRSHWKAGSSSTRFRYWPELVMGATSRS